jgi:RNA polymerase sigma-70 factor (ECF subfamily)
LRALDHLPVRQREVIIMLKVSGMSLEEVARATSATVGAIKQRAHRAYCNLRILLAKGSPAAAKNTASMSLVPRSARSSGSLG